MRLPFSFTHSLKTPHNMGVEVWPVQLRQHPHTPFFWLVMRRDLRLRSPFAIIKSSFNTFLSEEAPNFGSFFIWRAALDRGDAIFHYTTGCNFCQAIFCKKLFYFFFLKLLTFGAGCGIIITSGEGNQT